MPYFLERPTSNYAILSPGNFKSILANVPKIASRLKTCAIKKSLILQAFSHLDTRISGGASGHVYSPALSHDTIKLIAKIHAWKSFNPAAKVFTAFTSSSDESVADSISLRYQNIDVDHLSSPIFNNHDDWIASICDFFKNNITDSFLIIRAHPRQGSDHRGLPESPSFSSLIEILDRYSDCINILTIQPNSDISSYYLGLCSDYILNGWSTIGFELSLMGKPVIGSFHSSLCGSSYSFISKPCFYSSKSINQYHQLLISASCGVLSYQVEHGFNSLLYLLLISYSYVFPIFKQFLDSELVNMAVEDSLLPSIFDDSSETSASVSFFKKVQGQLVSRLHMTIDSSI